MRKNLRKWLLGVIAAVSLAVTACQGADVASGAGAAADLSLIHISEPTRH